MEIELDTNDKNKALKFTEIESLGSGAYKCLVTLNSNGFNYNNHIYFEEVNSFISSLEDMCKTLKGDAQLQETYHEHYIKFELTNIGHLIVSGLLIEYSEHNQRLQFEFVTDQTCLSSLLSGFKKLK